MFSVAKHCGRCANLVDFVFQAIWRTGQRDETGALVKVVPIQLGGRVPANKTVTGCAIAFCPRCFAPSLIEFSTLDNLYENIKSNLNEAVGLIGGESLVRIDEISPPIPKPESDPDWPAELVRHFADAQRFLMLKVVPSITTSVCRTVLDIATKTLEPSLADLKLYQRIEKLRDSGIITRPIADWAHDIRLDGNDAVHDGEGEEKDAEEYVAFLKMFLNMTFALPRRIARRRSIA